jgi:hypothetical protein
VSKRYFIFVVVIAYLFVFCACSIVKLIFLIQIQNGVTTMWGAGGRIGILLISHLKLWKHMHLMAAKCRERVSKYISNENLDMEDMILRR